MYRIMRMCNYYVFFYLINSIYLTHISILYFEFNY